MFNRFPCDRTPCKVYSFSEKHRLFLLLKCIDPLWRVLQALNKNTQNNMNLFDSKLSPRFEWCIFLLGVSPASEFYMPTFRNTLFHLHRRRKHTAIFIKYEDGTYSVPKRRHIKFRRRGITQKKEYKMRICLGYYTPSMQAFCISNLT